MVELRIWKPLFRTKNSELRQIEPPFVFQSAKGARVQRNVMLKRNEPCCSLFLLQTLPEFSVL